MTRRRSAGLAGPERCGGPARGGQRRTRPAAAGTKGAGSEPGPAARAQRIQPVTAGRRRSPRPRGLAGGGGGPCPSRRQPPRAEEAPAPSTWPQAREGPRVAGRAPARHRLPWRRWRARPSPARPRPCSVLRARKMAAPSHVRSRKRRLPRPAPHPRSRETRSPRQRQRQRPGGMAALQTRAVENQPYDESLDAADAEEEASAASPPGRPPSARAAAPRRAPGPPDTSSDEERGASGRQRAAPHAAAPRGFSADEDEDEDDNSSESEEEEEEEEHGAPLQGAYNPADYDYLPVSAEIKELFQYIRRYTPQTVELEHSLQPFIPDFIPAVGDIDAFLKVPRPDGKPDNLGLLVLDEPSTKQSDPTVLALWLTENSKQHSVSQVKVKSLENAEKNPKAIDNWVESISELHRFKPPATVHYTRPMPDIDALMQEWSLEFEELLGKVSLPTADISCGLAEYVDMICAILDIPVYKSRIQSLHVLFSLYSEFKNLQHFKALAEGKQVRSPVSNPPEAEADVLSFS
ncbi:intraflagellar transport protein 46 homolog isoform X3 [Alligator mississippiensis]|uniref:intraflagellar transport protein 46 homolog isoform X3 n=1 Tax=Alligator mississippiensis TaxID=8496 RepID=UPI0028775D03|nr:intraflagellar transport protein 46 homolog isoform X3 [Alligator mississippiensis]